MPRDLCDILENVDLDLVQLGAVVDAAAAGFSLNVSADPAAVLEHISGQIDLIDAVLHEAISICLKARCADAD